MMLMKNYSFEMMKTMIKERQNQLTRLTVLFVSYIAILQVLYALQTLFVSVPFVAIVSTIYFLLLQRSSSFQPLLHHSTGSNVKSSTTHERDLQTLLINETEQVLQTNLQHFQKVN